MALPKWFRDQMLITDAHLFGPRPTIDEAVARVGISRPRSPEEFLRELARDARRVEEFATRSVDDGMSADANIFGAPVKTIEQGRALGVRNLPGTESLSPEDQIALASALDKGAMLRAMSGVGVDPTISTGRGIRIQAGNRADEFTGRGSPFGMTDDLGLGDAMALLQNKRAFQRLTGLDGGLANPPVFQRGPGDALVPSETALALGDDVSELARTIRQDQIKSRELAIQEMQRADLEDAMAESTDEVAMQEARAREYDSFPPETLSDMAKANRSYMSRQSGRTERLTGNPLDNWARQMGGNMDPVVGSPRYPKSQEHLIRDGETSSDYWWRREGNDLMKGFGLGHVLSYPLMYAAYKMMQPGEPATKQVPYEPARQLGDLAQEEDQAFLEAEKAKARETMFDLPEVPIELPEEKFVAMPQDSVGVADDPMDLVNTGDTADLVAEQSPPPSIQDLDEELRRLGLQGVPSWYIRAMKDPSVKMIDGKPKEEFLPFSSQSKEYPIQQRYVLEGMTR